MLTTRDLATTHRALIDAEFVLNSDDGGGFLNEKGEPQYLDIVGAEKISAGFELTVRNPGGHSSAPRADNAIYELADVLKTLQSYRFPVMTNDWTLGSFKAVGARTPGALGEAMTRFAANPKDEAAADVISTSPYDVGKTRTTCVATMLRGGHATNALAQTATATVNCRIFPGTPVSDVQVYAAEARRRQSGGASAGPHHAGGRVAAAQGRDCRRNQGASGDSSGRSRHPGYGAVGDGRFSISRSRDSDVRRRRVVHPTGR